MGDLDAYLSCYSKSAVEDDGLRYDAMKSYYLDIFASSSHHLTITSMIIREGPDGINVKGSFNEESSAKLNERKAGLASTGHIEMVLIREDGNLKIKYFHRIAIS